MIASPGQPPHPRGVTLARVPIDRLREIDTATKPPGSNIEWAELSMLYADQNRAQTQEMLARLGLGLEDNDRPLDFASLVRQATHRSATVYNRAPSRWLVGPDGERISEEDPRHVAMTAALKKASYDLAWRKADRLRCLHEQVILRFYPSDHRRSVVVRIFEPHRVLREPDPACGDLMDHDASFAIELAGGVWEYWYRHPVDGAWCMVWCGKSGELHPRQPFRPEEDFRSPFEILPALQVYADFPGGAPWIPPRQGRQGWTQGIAALANDTLALAALQTHSQWVYKRENPENRLPDKIGPGTAITIDNRESLEAIKPSPAIGESQQVVKALLSMFAISEHLPANEFDPARPMLTGAALRVLLQPLIDRREDQVPMVPQDEATAWERFRAVHNLYAARWGRPELDPVAGIEVEVPDLEVPISPTDASNIAARRLALGLASSIDLIKEDVGCDRPDAIRRYQRVAEDMVRYPPPVMPAAPVEGPQLTSPPGIDPEPGPTPENQGPDPVLDGRPSVIGALRAAP